MAGLATLALASCSSAPLPLPDSDPRGPVTVDGVTTFIGTHTTADASPVALVVGTLSVVEGCLVVIEPGSKDGSVPLFPKGSSVLSGPDGLVIRTPDGELAVGDDVRLGGGGASGLDAGLADCAEVVPGGAFAVYSVEQTGTPRSLTRWSDS